MPASTVTNTPAPLSQTEQKIFKDKKKLMEDFNVGVA